MLPEAVVRKLFFSELCELFKKFFLYNAYERYLQQYQLYYKQLHMTYATTVSHSTDTSSSSRIFLLTFFTLFKDLKSRGEINQVFIHLYTQITITKLCMQNLT